MRKRPGRRRSDLPKEDIIRGYNEGASLRELAVKYGVGAVTIWRRVHAWSVEARHRGPIPKRDRHRYARFAETGNPGEGGAESNPGVSESPPSSIDSRHRQILELEAKIAAGELNLKRTHERKQAYEKELAILKGVPAR